MTAYRLKQDRPKIDWPKAEQDAKQNWGTWVDSFEANCPFSQLPVINNLHHFQSFLFEYSVSRGFSREDWLRFRKAAQLVEQIETHTELHKIAKRTLNAHRTGKERNVASMCSKLLSLWRPAKFPMMDQYAKNGIRKSLWIPRGKNFYQENDETYDNYRGAIWYFAEIMGEEMKNSVSSESMSSPAMRLRIIDNGLMEVGKLKG